MKRTHYRTVSRIAGAVLLAATAVWPARADYPSTVLGYNPLGYWRFNDAVVSPPLNVVSNSTALAPVGTGNIVDGAIKGQPGIVGNAVRFTNPTGTGHCGSKIDVPYNPAFNPEPPFSVEFWANPNSLSQGDSTGLCPVSNFDPNWYASDRAGWLFYVNTTGRWQFRLGNTGGYAAVCTGGSGNATLGSWQHVVGTFDGTNANLYINGVVVATASATASWVPNGQSFLRIGGTPLEGDALSDAGYAYVEPASSASSNDGNRGWDGWVDELAIYPKLLSPSTIAAHYAAATTNNAGYDAQILAAGPVGYWNLDEPAVTAPDPSTFPTVTDSGSLGASANGTALWGALAAQQGANYAGFGAADKAIFFDGDTGSVAIEDNASLHFSGNFTLMAWIKPTEEDFYRDIIAHGLDSQGAETFLRISRGAGTGGYGDGNYYEVGSSDGQTYYDSALAPIPPGDIGNWVFLAGTYDGANFDVYRNGLLVASQAPSSGDGNTGALDVTNRWFIGSGSDPLPNYGLFFGGSIGEPAIFSSALSASAITALYNAAQVPPVITQAPELPSGPVYLGSSLTLSVWAEGAPSLSYSWISNGIPTGVTATNITFNNLPVGQDTIAVIVTNPYGSTTSSVTFAVVTAPPSILQEPSPTTRFAGFPFVFSVTAGGTAPLTYFWELNGTVVQAGPSATYSNLASLANAGNYSVIVSNLTGVTVTSTTNALTVNSIPSGYASAVIASGPIAYWRLDETSGTVAHDGIGGNDGAYFKTTLGVPGYSVLDPDTAVAFSGPNSYVGGINGSAINFPGHSSFSLEAWVNAPAGQSDQATVIAKGIGNNGTTETEQFSLDVAGGVYRFFTSDVANPVLAATGVSGPNGTWQHLVGVYDDAGGKMYLYVNGVQEGTHATRAQGLVDTTTPISIGSKRTGNDPNYDGTFNGTVDEVSIYNVALDPTTIYNHYSAAYGTSLKPFIAIQPAATTNYVTLPVILTVSAAGSVPLSYQWSFNGAPIADATDSAYTNAAVALSDAGNYTVAISNSLGGVVSAPAALAVLPTPTKPVTIPDLVVHLPFNNNLTDTTGRGNNGTGYHVTTTSTNSGVNPSAANSSFYYVSDGVLGSALHYTTAAHNTSATTSAADETYYVSLGVRPDLQFGSNVSFTVAFWIRLAQGFIGGDLPFFTDTVGSEGNAGFDFAPAYGYGTANPKPTTAPANDGGWAYTIYDGSANGVRVYGDLGSINDGNWHHLVYVIRRSGATSQVYLDGVPAHSETDAGSYAGAAGDIDTGHAAVIGQDATGFYGEAGSADIEDLGVWRRALAPIEAAGIYAAAAPGLLSPGTGISFVGSTTVPPVSIALVPGSPSSVKLTWSYGTLQSASAVTGPYKDVTDAVSPYTVSGPSGNTFYRIRE